MVPAPEVQDLAAKLARGRTGAKTRANSIATINMSESSENIVSASIKKSLAAISQDDASSQP